MIKAKLVAMVEVLALALSACGGGSDTERQAASPAAEPAESPEAVAGSPQGTCLEAGAPPGTNYRPSRVAEFGSPTQVPGRANIWGAGHDAPPAPGSGGGGVLPPVWPLPDGASAVTFPKAKGRVWSIVGDNGPFGPAGDTYIAVDIESYQGISGILNRNGGFFLTGVFLTDESPSDPAPERLDFGGDGEEFDVLEPEIAQTFLIGDGKGRTYRVPPGATRLFLGLPDAFAYHGCPGWYDNNSGELTVTAEVATE